jgi:hypothetical protein
MRYDECCNQSINVGSLFIIRRKVRKGIYSSIPRLNKWRVLGVGVKIFSHR